MLETPVKLLNLGKPANVRSDPASTQGIVKLILPFKLARDCRFKLVTSPEFCTVKSPSTDTKEGSSIDSKLGIFVSLINISSTLNK